MFRADVLALRVAFVVLGNASQHSCRLGFVMASASA
jgi:hypothetical protein